MSFMTFELLCADRLSIITISPKFRNGQSCFFHIVLKNFFCRSAFIYYVHCVSPLLRKAESIVVGFYLPIRGMSITSFCYWASIKMGHIRFGRRFVKTNDSFCWKKISEKYPFISAYYNIRTVLFRSFQRLFLYEYPIEIR